MKKTTILIIVLALTISCFSQSDFQKKILEKDKKICELQNELQRDIHNEWQKIKNDSLIKNPKDCYEKLNKEKAKWNDSIKTIQTRINNLKKDSWVEDLRKYYQNGKIDQLYAHADLLLLSTHKDILGENYPKKMDSLEVLLKCSELFKNKYNANDNKAYQEKLKEVSECETKNSLQYLLSQQKDITDEVDEWIKDEKKHTLFGMKMFYNEIEDGYKVSFEEDYPYLAQIVRDKVMEKMRQHSSGK